VLRKGLIVLNCLFISFNLQAKGLEGYWISIKNDEQHSSYIAQFTKNKVLITELSNVKSTQHSLTYQHIDSSRIEVEGIDRTVNVVIDIDLEENSMIFPIPGVVNIETFRLLKSKFVKAPEIEILDIVGTWTESHKSSASEQSFIITYKKDSNYMDVDGVRLNHKKKTYEEIKRSVKMSLTKGFIFTDLATLKDEEYVYYLYSSIDDEMYFIDRDGNKWTQKREGAPKLPSIPDGYKRRSDKF